MNHTEEWKNLEKHAKDSKLRDLKNLSADEKRTSSFSLEKQGIFLDYSRQCASIETLSHLEKLAMRANLFEKIDHMFSGETINKTENRSVLHVALRASHESSWSRPEVHEVLAQIKIFSEKIRGEEIVGFTGKPLKNTVCIGIGGSYLGPEFVYEAFRSSYPSDGRTLRFLANVDPIDVSRALNGLNAEETLVVVISKTFTTAETLLNAKTVREWLYASLGSRDSLVVQRHVVAVSTALDKTKTFGIAEENVFGFWDWVGGRYSVCSAVGILPLALHFGFEVCQEFLKGAEAMDSHFKEERDLWKNLPCVMGLLSVWNSSFLNIPCNAILPYCQSLLRFVAHIQQVDMESNGKTCDLDGKPITFNTGQVIFGEPGTNGQHSFYQLLHQGSRIISADFIGFKKSTNPVRVDGESVSNHDELMSNFFAQPDALAFGKSDKQNNHKNFEGNRPSLSLLLPVCDAFHVGTLLALYEHRTAVQSFIWNINAFDQFGVELGKSLAKDVRNFMSTGAGMEKFPSATQRLLHAYKAD